jgi:hypothetical protein
VSPGPGHQHPDVAVLICLNPEKLVWIGTHRLLYRRALWLVAVCSLLVLPVWLRG